MSHRFGNHRNVQPRAYEPQGIAMPETVGRHVSQPSSLSGHVQVPLVVSGVDRPASLRREREVAVPRHSGQRLHEVARQREGASVPVRTQRGRF